jgi:hypothetical protein
MKTCRASNRSLPIVEPVSRSWKRKLEKCEQRLAPKKRRLGTVSARFAGQRLRSVCLSLGNVVRSHTPGNAVAETALVGWGERIRTSELQKPRLSNWRVGCDGAAAAARVSVSFIEFSVRLATASRAVTTEAPQWPRSRRGRIPKSESAQSGAHSDALFAAEIQSFLDHLVAGLRLR